MVEFRFFDIGYINVSLEKVYGDGDVEPYSLILPFHTFDLDEDELREWFKKRDEQMKISKTIIEIEEKIVQCNDLDEQFQQGFKNLKDPEWVYKKLEQLNKKMKKNHFNKTKLEMKLSEMKKQLDDDFKVNRENDGFPTYYVDSIVKGMVDVMLGEREWRDICNKNDENT